MTDTTKDIGAGAVSQSGQALQIQTYCCSVLQQIDVDFSNTPSLSSYETEINGGLATAQGHANNYLNNIQPLIITNLSNISNYFSLQNAVLTVLPAGSTNAEWIDSLNALLQSAQTYQTAANSLVTTLTTLSSDLASDVKDFSKIVSDLNATLNGDNGVLAQLADEASQLNGQIDGCIAGIVVSSLAIIAGAFITAVGAVADFVTAGASTPVVLGGLAIIAAGVGGEAGAGVALGNLLSAKAALYQKQSTLSAEVLVSAQISHGYAGLQAQAENAVTAATQMYNAWESLNADLNSLIDDLQNGTTSGDAVRQLWLTAADSTVKTVLTDISTIKGQMAGVKAVSAPTDQTLVEFYKTLSQ